ncbi:MAG TPA: heme o synthase [Thermomicrobiales bacterium]|nr:heme o synthase [Thermomicrobiales bacterium]
MSESMARTGVSRLSLAVAMLAFALIVVAGADLPASGTDTCTGWGDCSGWTYLSSASGAIGRLHLAVAGLTGLATIALVALAWLRLRDDSRVIRAAIAALGLIGVQVVAVLLPASDAAASWGATIHFAATALLLALAIYLVALPSWQALRAATTATSRYRTVVGWSVAAIFAVILSGAYLTASGNTTDCGWPACDASGASGVISTDAQGLHRLLVVSAAVLLLTLAVQTVRSQGPSRLRTVAAVALLAIFAVEIVVGGLSATGSDGALISATHFGAAGMSWSLLIVLALATGATQAGTIQTETQRLPLRVAARDYLRVMKPGIIVLLLITTVGAMLVAGPWPSIWLVLATMLGGALASGGASALNCYIDRDIDPVMARTRKRPLPTGRLTPVQVRSFGLALSVLAVIELWLLVNPLAAMLALAGNVFYVMIYTNWLKRSTPQNIVIGGAAGAFPPLVGWAAVTGTISLPALLLFAIIFYWTPPHFWSLALLKARDYERAGIPMLPVTHGAQYTRKLILLYAVLLVGITMLVVPAGAAGWLYLTLATALGAVFVGMAARMYLEGTSRLAWRLFKFSNYYLTLILAAMVLDKAL